MPTPPNSVSVKECLTLLAPDGTTRAFDLGAPFREDRQALIEDYWLFHPRFRFVKCLRPSAVLLDFGAGDGGTVFWRGWMRPERPDIVISAIDLRVGEHFSHYHDYDIADVSRERSKFEDASFDYVLSASALEYIPNIVKAAEEISRVTRDGGRIYVEYPNPASVSFPTLETLRSLNIFADPLNFYDDQDRQHVLGELQIQAILGRGGFRRLCGGVIVNDWLSDELVAYGYHRHDREIASAGLRLAYGQAAYLILEKA